MGNIHVLTLAEATERYTNLRRWFYLFVVGMLLVVGLFAGIHAVGPRNGSAGQDILDFLLFLVFLACYGGSNVMWELLINVRCPRCGEPLISSAGVWSTAANHSCQHPG